MSCQAPGLCAEAVRGRGRGAGLKSPWTVADRDEDAVAAELVRLLFPMLRHASGGPGLFYSCRDPPVPVGHDADVREHTCSGPCRCFSAASATTYGTLAWRFQTAPSGEGASL